MFANRLQFIVSAVVKGQLVKDTFYAVSLKQARYYYGKKYGFAFRDFTQLNKGLEDQYLDEKFLQRVL